MNRRILLSFLFALGAMISPPVAHCAAVNYQGLWWNANQSGWGINFAHQGDVIFATWFTYDTDRKPWWFIASLTKSGGLFSGDIFAVSGQALNSEPWLQSRMRSTNVGSMTVTFASESEGRLTTSLQGISQSRYITKQVWGVVPTCIWGAQTDLTKATNYTDIWWNPDESGWGINLTHQSDTIYGTWFTYDADGKPWWLASTMRPNASGGYSGDVSTITGPPFYWDWEWGNPGSASVKTVGTMTARFADGNHASLDYTVNDIKQTKAITRQIFVPPGTVCGVPPPVPPPVPVATLNLCQVSTGSSGGETCSPGVFILDVQMTIKQTGIPQPSDLSFGTYRLSASDGNVTISNVTAVDSNGVVKPYFTGISEGMTISPGSTVTMKLMSPPTRGLQADERFEFHANGKRFMSIHVLLTTD